MIIRVCTKVEILHCIKANWIFMDFKVKSSSTCTYSSLHISMASSEIAFRSISFFPRYEPSKNQKIHMYDIHNQAWAYLTLQTKVKF